MSETEAICSFCGKAASQVEVLIEERGCYICDECVEVCAELLREKKQKHTAALGRDPSSEGDVSTETHSGVVAWFDDERGYGYIRMENGHPALLHITCLRAGGYPSAKEGARIEFEALRRRKGLSAYRILSLEDG